MFGSKASPSHRDWSASVFSTFAWEPSFHLGLCRPSLHYSVLASDGFSVVTGLTTPVTEYYNGDFGSGTSASPGVQVVFDVTPKFVTLHVKGRDDDTLGGFETSGCGGSPSEYDFASGSRNLTLPAGAVSTAKQTFLPFNATGSEDLEFGVHRTWQVIP